jgi:hypothetical protein
MYSKYALPLAMKESWQQAWAKEKAALRLSAGYRW